MNEKDKKLTFSERTGNKPINKALQIDSMNDDLRMALWNIFYIFFFDGNKSRSISSKYKMFFSVLWINYFKLPYDQFPVKVNEMRDFIKSHILTQWKWYEVYDFIERIPKVKDIPVNPNEFKDTCNKILNREHSAYRFIDEHLTPIVENCEIEEIEKALKSSFSSVQTHVRRALELLSDKNNPDYRNSIKESISAVEALCRIIAEDNSATLSDAIKTMKKKKKMHSQFEQAILNLYNYSSDNAGIRHSLTESTEEVTLVEARFVLVTVSAFINYITWIFKNEIG
ncbi:hypothetical protein KAU32_06950 [bacterium]|nr:hypothetical protein [bacterium]